MSKYNQVHLTLSFKSPIKEWDATKLRCTLHTDRQAAAYTYRPTAPAQKLLLYCIDCARFKEWRVDGWPLCPQCGEDELYSIKALAATDNLTLEETLLDDFKCYRCSSYFPSSETLLKATAEFERAVKKGEQQ